MNRPKKNKSVVSFFVPGIPAPGGSKKGFINPKTNRVVIVDDAKRNKSWRALVALVASQSCNSCLSGPLAVEITFTVPRPKSHYRADRIVKSNAPAYPITRPDATKLWRSTEDALKGIVWLDDSQVVEQYVRKRYGERPGAMITITQKEGE